MKLKDIVSIFILCSTMLGFSQIRQRAHFNDNWKFILSDSAVYSKIKVDDSNWRVLKLPHDWSVEGEFNEKNGGRNAWLPGGIAWYRKSFELPKTDEGKHFEIQFDGIYRHSQVWVNGVFIGVQYDGYTSFYYDITEALKFGEENSIAIQVDNSVQPNCRWYSGSGIYRNVWLTKTDLLHVKNWGTYITTPEISKENAVIFVQTTIENRDVLPKDFVLETIIFNSEGKEVARTETNKHIGNLRSFDMEQKLNVANPELWSLDAPKRYATISKIKVNGNVVDDYTSSFGIRTIAFDAKKGFFLNGENMKMKGVCLHHEAGAFGAAVPIQIWERRLRKLKAIGCNAIRTAHNPHAPEFLDLCDKLGFLVMDEFVDKWDNISMENAFYDTPFADPYFHTEWQQNFGETVRRDRNHPSVIIWSVGNENHPSGNTRQNAGLKRYTSFVRSMDPTRPVISGMERGGDLKSVDRKVDNIIKSCSFMDLIALNYGEQWCELIADRNPGKPFISTESYGYFNSSKEERWANLESNPWLDVIANENNMGSFLWVGIGYLGESRNWPRLGSNSGLFDLAGFSKVRSKLFEAFWSEKPVVDIQVYEGHADDFSTSGKWGWPPMNASWNLEKGKTYDVVTYTNCEEVDLYLNNKKIGTQKLADIPNWIMKWREVEHESGMLRAVGKIDGKAVCEAKIVTTSKPSKIVLEEFKTEFGGNNIIQVEVTLTDKKGNLIVDNDRKINFNLEGDGEILVLTNGNNNAVEQLQQKEQKATYKGKLLCVIKANENAKKLKLIASGDDIKTETIEIDR